MAENGEFAIIAFETNLCYDFRKQLRERIQAYGEWVKQLSALLDEKLANPEITIDTSTVKTPRQKRDRSMLSDAKSGTKRKKKRWTKKVSAVLECDADGIEADVECSFEEKNEKKGALQQQNVFENMADTPKTRESIKPRCKTRASRALVRSVNDEKISDGEEKKQMQPLPNQRLTRAMRQTLLHQLKEEEEKENNNDNGVLESKVEEHKESDSEEKDVFFTPKNKELVAESAPPLKSQKTPIPDNHNVSENEWLTDDESPPEVTKEETKASPVEKKSIGRRKSKRTHISRTSVASTVRVTRAQARIEAKLQQSGRTMVTRTMQKNLLASGGSGSNSESETNLKTFGSSARSLRSVSRLKPQGSATKNLTESARKRREELEQRRLAQLEQLQLKEMRVLEQREKYMQQKVAEHKLKREEKEKKAAQIREQQKKEQEAKKRQEIERKEEIERRKKEREERTKAKILERQQELAAKQAEAEQRKLREEQERIQKLEEANKKKKEEQLKRKQEEDRINAIIQQHNNSLQQKAIANSFLKKTVGEQKTPPQQVAMDKTFTLNTASSVNNQPLSYAVTPPPKTIKKPPNPEQYDITDIKSDDDTDDERMPRKPIPSWAKGEEFIKALEKQYRKPKKRRDQIVEVIFEPVKLPVILEEIFKGNRAVASKYAKRTSSAIWDSSPVRGVDSTISSDSSISVFN